MVEGVADSSGPTASMPAAGIADQFAAEPSCDLAERGTRLHPITCRPWR